MAKCESSDDAVRPRERGAAVLSVRRLLSGSRLLDLWVLVRGDATALLFFVTVNQVLVRLWACSGRFV